MKTNMITLSALLGMLMVLAGCEKDLMDYEGKDTLYFDVRRGPAHLPSALWPHEFYTDVSFGTMVANEQELTLKVMAAGGMKDYDRPFQVVINKDSTTAVAGQDFIGFDGNCVIKAGESGTTFSIKVNRTEAMLDDTLQLQFQLVPNEHFDVKYEVYRDYPGMYGPTENMAFAGNKNGAIHNLFFYDVLSMPRGEDGLTTSGGWYGQDKGGTGKGLFGNFSPKKFRLMMEITGTTVDDYKSKKTMPAPRATAISEQMAAYLLEKAQSRETVVLDEDGTMMYFMAVESMGGTKGWAPFTKPEDYFK